jgi:hypothetical protein
MTELLNKFAWHGLQLLGYLRERLFASPSYTAFAAGCGPPTFAFTLRGVHDTRPNEYTTAMFDAGDNYTRLLPHIMDIRFVYAEEESDDDVHTTRRLSECETKAVKDAIEHLLCPAGPHENSSDTRALYRTLKVAYADCYRKQQPDTSAEDESYMTWAVGWAFPSSPPCATPEDAFPAEIHITQNQALMTITNTAAAFQQSQLTDDDEGTTLTVLRGQ